jgi:hypothetical protein
MTEHHPERAPEQAPEQPEPAPDEPEQAAGQPERPAGEPAAVDHPAVDEVLRSMERLDARPVDEHVAVFEQAHESLRRTLSEGDAGDRPGQG